MKTGARMRQTATVLWAAAALTIAAGICCAAEETVPEVHVSPSNFKTWTGEIDSVKIGNAERSSNSELVVSNGDRVQTFIMVPSTRITDAEGKTIPPGGLTAGSKVSVEYKTRADGTLKAQTIKVQ